MADAEQTLRRTALTIVCLGAFITPLMLSAVNVAIPTIAEGLEMDAITASWVPLAYLLSSGVFLLPFGRLGDMHGRKKMFLSGMITVTVASLSCLDCRLTAGADPVPGLAGHGRGDAVRHRHRHPVVGVSAGKARESAGPVRVFGVPGAYLRAFRSAAGSPSSSAGARYSCSISRWCCWSSSWGWST